MRIRPNRFHLSFNFVLAAIAIVFASTSTSFAGDFQQRQSDKGKDYQIAIDFPQGSQVRVAGEYEYEGSVIVMPEIEHDKKAKPPEPKVLPLRVSANLKYDQRTTGSNQAVRIYESAVAKINLDTGKTKPELEIANRLIVARLKTKPQMRVEMASIKNMLNQKEYELLQTAADPLSLPLLFSKKKANIGEKWEPNLIALAKFLNVDKIITTDVKMQLKSVKNDKARVYVSGGVTANQYDVTSAISLSGYVLVDLGSKQVESAKLSTEERSPPGQISPGFNGRARIDVNFTHGVKNVALSNKALAEAMRSSKIAQRLKFESNTGNYRISYDPRWKLIAGESDTAIMRFVDKGDLLSQCTLVMLPRRAANQPLEFTKYKQQITNMVEGDTNAKVVKSSQTKTKTGMKAMSVVVAGEEEGLPVNWIYYHVQANDGRQMTFVFTLAESVADRVVGAANQLINEFEFLGAPTKVAKKTSTKVAKKRQPNVYTSPK